MRLIGLLFLMSVLLSGCGFHLQGTLLADKLPFKSVTITPDDPFDPVYKQLRYQLEAKRVCVKAQCKPCCTTQPCIRLVNHTFTEIPFVYGPDGDVRREKIILELEYEYNYKKRVITARRFWQLNLNHNLANIAEKEMIKREMIVDVVQQLLVQLTSPCFSHANTP